MPEAGLRSLHRGASVGFDRLIFNPGVEAGNPAAAVAELIKDNGDPD